MSRHTSTAVTMCDRRVRSQADLGRYNAAFMMDTTKVSEGHKCPMFHVDSPLYALFYNYYKENNSGIL